MPPGSHEHSPSKDVTEPITAPQDTTPTRNFLDDWSREGRARRTPFRSTSQIEKSFSSEGARNAWKEITDAEKQGDIIGAYSIAKNAGNYYKANILARDYNITGHEYTKIVHFQGNDVIEDAKICLESRLKGATGSRLGFRSFDGKTVVDVGTRDGRYIPFFKSLGAKDIYGVDPDTAAINTAIEKGLLSKERAIPTTMEEVPDNLKGTFDIATVFNLNPDLARNEKFIQSLSDALPPHGQVVMTVVETETYQNVLPLMYKHFSVRSEQLWTQRTDDTIHSYLIVADKPFS